MRFNVITPKTKTELLKTMRAEGNFRFGAGYTDLLLEMKKSPKDDFTVINLSQVDDALFTGIRRSSKESRLGAMVTAHKIVMNEGIRRDFPVLREAAFRLASTQIRQVATIGGNLCTASPSGDISCALTALEADCEILCSSGVKRVVPVRDFFSGVRKTVLKKNEVLYGITVPANKRNAANVYSRFIKIGMRRSMECSVVSLAFHFQIDEIGKIIGAGVAIGAAAPTIRFARSAGESLLGKRIDSISAAQKEEFAEKVLSYAEAISDIRATAWYRTTVLYNISKAVLDSPLSGQNR